MADDDDGNDEPDGQEVELRYAEGDARLIEAELKPDALWIWVEMADGVRVELTLPYGHWAFDDVNRSIAHAAEQVIRRLHFDPTGAGQVHVFRLQPPDDAG